MMMKAHTNHVVVPPLRLSRGDVIAALKSRGDEQRRLHKAALEVKQRVYGNGVMLRGVIEITNVCRVSCDYCPMRRDNNRSNDKFFMSAADIVARARIIRDAGIDIVLLQGGETPKAAAATLEAIPGILELFNNAAEIILNLGSLGSSYYQQFKEAGATAYILKHETSSAPLHAALRHEELAYRIREWYLAREAGLKMGTGIISGLPGQGYAVLADEIIFIRTMAPDMISVSPFVPAPNTPLSESSIGNVDDALNFLALTRLEHPYALIPSVSALEKNSSGGQGRGIAAGANVMTINFTGHLSNNYLIYGKDRFVVQVDHVKKVLSDAGAQPVRSGYL